MVVWQSSHLFTHWPWEQKNHVVLYLWQKLLKRIRSLRTTRMLITCGLWWVVVATYSTGSIIYRHKKILRDCHLYLHNFQRNKIRPCWKTSLSTLHQEVVFFWEPVSTEASQHIGIYASVLCPKLNQAQGISKPARFVCFKKAPSMSFWRFWFQKKPGPIERLSMGCWCVFLIKICIHHIIG